MSEILLPYQLFEGTKAYAAKVMANFEAILLSLNELNVLNISTGDISSVLNDMSALVSSKIASGEIGNASEVTFADGETMQQKLDAGSFNGADAVVGFTDGWASFNINDDGELIVTTTADVNAFSINESGELVYTIEDAETSESVTEYNLGSVVGEKGATGGITTAEMESYVAAQLAAISSSSRVTVLALATSWVDGEISIDCDGITADNNFIVQPTITATEEERSAWASLSAYVIAQAAAVGETSAYFTIKTDGTAPDVNIPLTVVINV